MKILEFLLLWGGIISLLISMVFLVLQYFLSESIGKWLKANREKESADTAFDSSKKGEQDNVPTCMLRDQQKVTSLGIKAYIFLLLGSTMLLYRAVIIINAFLSA